jgi:peptidoglycan/LPS O-acetylase OafA/YrhL
MSLQPAAVAMSAPRVRGETVAEDRFEGADRLRFAALLTIVAFHVVLRSAQIEALARLPPSRLEDALIGGATLFDNRSLAILSLYLLLVRHRDRPVTETLTERVHRLLVPYVAWTVAYALLDFCLAALTGNAKEGARVIGDLGYWMRGLVFATTTPHLHFLPTLLFLTLLLPLTRIPLPIAAGIALLCVAAALRILLEVLLIPHGLPETAGPAILAPLMAGRIIESLPAGFLAARLALGPAITVRARISAGVGALLAITIAMLLPTDLFEPVAQGGVPLGLMLTQAEFGTLAMALAAIALLTAPAGRPSRSSIAAWFAPLAFGVFLVHPFINEAFDILVPLRTGPEMLAIRFVFVLMASTLIAQILSRSRRFARFV